jgi:Calcineurin-like phosphoesterase
MKLLVIPDVHGIPAWKRQVFDVIQKPDSHIVFLGDYVDNYYIKSLDILDNFKEIVALKKQYPTKVTLLLGNHDYAYVFGKFYTSGFDYHMWYDYRQLINDNWNLFDMAWGYQGKERYTLLTHAGLTRHFYNNLIDEIYDPRKIMYDILVADPDVDWRALPLHELLNFFADQVHLMWQIGLWRNGTDKTGSTIWCDKHELVADAFEGIDQIVGHTVGDYVEVRYTGRYKNDKIFFTDVHTDDCLSGFMIELV